jgi:hypothetical protein
LSRNSKVLLGIAMTGLLVLLATSCGDDGVRTPPCTNCGFWEIAYGGVGRFPAASPDPNVIAFASRYQFPEKIEYPFDPGDLGIDQYYHIWIARVEDISDTVWYYQVTSGGEDDFLPAWSSGGDLIAFERNIGQQDERQIFVVDVEDPENPGTPQQVTDHALKPPAALGSSYRNISPSWVDLAGKTWLAFVNYPNGLGDYDIGLLSWDDLSDTVWVSVDPADFAAKENGVMSFVFRDQQAAGNGSRLIAFSSPDRRRVGDIKVVASTQERPDSSLVTEIFVNGKTSLKQTPYTFRYRPAGIRVRISSRTEGYCAEAGDSLVPLPDTTNVFLIDFVHTRGTIGVGASRGGLFIYMDGDKLLGPDGVELKTKDPGQYVYVKCVLPDLPHELYTEDVFGTVCGDTAEATVAVGETTWVDFDCEGLRVTSRTGSHGSNLTGGFAPGCYAGGEAPLLTQQERRGIWVVDTGEDAGIADDRMLRVDPGSPGANYPVISPDGNYVAYFRGEYTSWEIVIADVSGLIAGTGAPIYHVVGLPGSGEDFECWRKPEKISWVPVQNEARIVVSLSPCRGGAPEAMGIWVADVSQFLK